MRMKLSDFNYEVPNKLIAEYPNKTRDEAKLMVIDRKDYSIQNRQFKDMIEYFNVRQGSLIECMKRFCFIMINCESFTISSSSSSIVRGLFDPKILINTIIKSGLERCRKRVCGGRDLG